MNKRILVILIFLLVAVSMATYAQHNYKEGWLVTNEKDTLYGYINDGGDIKNSKFCVFKNDKHGNEERYYPQDILSYRMNGDKYYVSRKLDASSLNRNCFMEVLIAGEVNLLYYYKNAELLYYLEMENGRTVGLKNLEYSAGEPYSDYLPVNWNAYVPGTVVYKDSLFLLFREYPALLNQLHLIEYDHQSLINLTREYLDLTCSGKPCLTYTKNLHPMKNRVAIYSGLHLSKFSYTDYEIGSRITASPVIGIGYTIPVTHISERLYIQVEVTGWKLGYDDEIINETSRYDSLSLKFGHLGLPLSVNYAFPVGKITPYIGAGREFGFTFNSDVGFKTYRYDENGIWSYGAVDYFIHRIQKEGWFGDLGIVYDFNSKFEVFANLRYQFHQNLIIEESNFNNLTFRVAELSTYGERITTNSLTLRTGIRF